MPKEPLSCDVMLTSKTEFMQFLNCSEIVLEKKYVPLGLPGVVVNRSWFGSTEEIRKWWNTLTSAPIRNTAANPIKISNVDDFE